MRVLIYGGGAVGLGLARFGGLRCPSEILRLKWIDVDFEKQRFTVHASKTEHHADKGIRTVPMFPELRPLFQDAFDKAEDGAVYCIERHRNVEINLRTQLSRIIKRAGLEPWPKLFQNCRSTRLFKMTGGNVKAVCSWIGNTPAVALNHYAQITETDLREAAKMTVLNEAESSVCKEVHNPVHNPVQNTAEPSRTEPHETLEPIAVVLLIARVNTNLRELARRCKMRGIGRYWTRTNGLLHVEQALYPTELTALVSLIISLSAMKIKGFLTL